MSYVCSLCDKSISSLFRLTEWNTDQSTPSNKIHAHRKTNTWEKNLWLNWKELRLFQDGNATVHLSSLKCLSFLQYSASLCSSQHKCSEIWVNHCCLLEGFTPELILVLWRLSVLNSHRLDLSPGVMLCNELLEFAVSIPLCYSLFLFYYNENGGNL